MTSQPALRILNLALSQQDRVASAPRPEALAIDGRSLAQLLAFGAHYGCLIRFYDLADMPHGDWSVFFGADPAVAAAIEAALDLPDIVSALRRMLATARAALERYRRQVVHVERAVHRLIIIVDADPVQASDGFDTCVAAKATRARNDSLAQPLRDLHQHRRHRTDLDDWARHDLDLLEALADALLSELTHRRASAQARLDVSLTQRGHAPQAALWIAFVQLYVKARGALNRFPQRLIEFYYRDVLRQNHRDAVPAQAYLAFTLTKGTRFLAGTDAAGQPITYAASQSLDVVPAAVTGLSVHRVCDDGSQTGVLIGTVDRDVPGAFPIFGGSQPGQFGALQMQPSGLGFSLSSNVLMLTSGQRDVVVTLASATPLQSPEVPGAAWFTMQYSTAGGWMTVEDLRFDTTVADDGRQILRFTFRLPPGAPPLVAAATRPAPGTQTPDQPLDAFPGFATTPTLIIQLSGDPATANGQSDSSAYQVLSAIRIATITIDVAVTGMVPEKLASSGGAIDPSQNFPVFGITPVQMSSLRIWASELFVKTPDRVALVIDWAGQPVDSCGFAGWYRDYTVPADGQTNGQSLFDNTSFKVSLAPASPGPWTAASGRNFYLFQTAGSSTAGDGPGPAPSAPLSGQSVLTLGSITPADQPPLYFDPAANALQLVLQEPAYAFGQTLYARNLMAASSANAEALRSAPTTTPAGLVSSASSAITAAPDKDFADTAHKTIGATVSGLQSHAFAALHKGVSASPLDAATQAQSHAELAAAMTGSARAGMLQRLIGKTAAQGSAGVSQRLTDWLTTWRDQLAMPTGNRALQAGEGMLQAASAITDVWQAASGNPAPLSRALIGTALQSGLKTIQTTAPTTVLPNPPWLPLAASVRIDYAAQETCNAAEAARNYAGAGATGGAGLDSSQGALVHLNAFGDAVPVKPPLGDSDLPAVWLLPNVSGAAALYIDLSQAVDAVSLLFVIEVGTDGGDNGTSDLTWQKQIGTQWLPVGVVSDTTNALRNTGIVRLQVGSSPNNHTDIASRLRAVLTDGCTNNACITSVTANAVTVNWVGPGGAETLGTPMPAGTIAKSESPLAGVGSIKQPMAGFGGAPAGTGKAFDAWMAEHLRHKGRAIAGDDYARVALAAMPSLWQMAVIPATDDVTGLPAPGRVWLTAVAGPQSPNIADPTTPGVDTATLGEIAQALSAIASPFARITVTNPPWTRIKVSAVLVFTDDDTAFARETRLHGDLVRWLSPWPDPALPPRGDDYWTRQAIAQFIRDRPYVVSIVSLALEHERDPATGWHYFTSALTHDLEAFTPPPVSLESALAGAQ